MDIKDKCILVTGSSQGLGEQIARKLAAAGGKVIINCAHHAAAAQKIAAEIGASVRIFDISDPQAVSKAFGDLPLDVLINNARLDPYRRPPDMPDSEWFDRITAVNLKGPYLCSLAALEIMKQRGGGKIINISSVWAYRSGGHRMLEYAMTKAALHSLGRSFAELGAPHHITVNTVAPGMIVSAEMRSRLSSAEISEMTHRIPLGRGGDAAEIVKAIEFLIGNDYITGEILNINGGTYLP